MILITFKTIFEFFKTKYNKYKNLIKSILTIFIILCILVAGFIFINKVKNYFFKKYSDEKKTLIENNNKLLKEKDDSLKQLEITLKNRDKIIKELKDKQKEYTQENLNSIDCKNKDKIILNQQNQIKQLTQIIDNDTELLNKAKKDIEDLKIALEETNTQYAKTPEPKKNSLKPFLAGGFSTPTDRWIPELDVYAGLKYERNLLSTKLVDIGIEFGVGAKLYKKTGMLLEIAPVIRF